VATMIYGPQALGARCDVCPLREARQGDPVSPQWPEDPLALLIGANPGPTEVEKGRPFVGPAGLELNRNLEAAGLDRERVAVTNAILCCPPGPARGALERFTHTIQRENAGRLKYGGGEPIQHPLDCCRPRLQKEIEACPRVVTLGATALQAVTGQAEKVLSARGNPRTLESGVELVPTLHPSFVLTARRWRGPFVADLNRARRWFSTGALEWRDVRVLWKPTPKELKLFLDRIKREPFSVFDVETSPGYPKHFEPLADKLRCLGIGIASGQVAVIPFRSVEGEFRRFYSPDDEEAIEDLLRAYFADPAWKKASWNGRYYDRMVLEQQLGMKPSHHLDAIGLSRLACPELPHDLGFAGSVYTDVTDWKAGRIALDADSDLSLAKYNAIDVVVTAQVAPKLLEEVKRRDQGHLTQFFAQLQDVCVGLHRNGMRVDEARRREWDRKLILEANFARKLIQTLANRPDMNPGSTRQLGDLLFDEYRILPLRYSEKTGEPSTDDQSLRAFLGLTYGLSESQKRLVRAVRDFRRITKRRGVVVRLRPIKEKSYLEPNLADIEDEEEEGIAPGLCLPDGRVHGNYAAHGTVGWRFSSSGPNMQNFTDRLRDIFVPSPGNVFVGCDEAQLELRMVAGLAKCEYYCQEFRRDSDPHRALCIDTFGDRFLKATAAQQKRFRLSVKGLTYASLYGAGNATKLETITASEEENEETGEVCLAFPDFTLREVCAFSDAWHRRCPEIADWWEKVIQDWQRDGFLAEPILGLKRDFLDGEERSEILNYLPQSGGAGLVHLATLEALGKIPFERWGPGTGLVHQGHDSLLFEVPDTEGERTARLLEKCMSEDGAKYGLPVRFKGEAKVGRNWRAC